MNNPASYNRGYFEGNFDLPMMKKRIGNEKRTLRKMAKKGGVRSLNRPIEIRVSQKF